ncbi:TraR/DksA C4-type zinc finger protein [Pseudomonas aeruginosa]|uniref:TraR/DksA C4-type zinc finger protein n=1 Tax=Pseudomonas aeruginosa TaxID=287 RepID=UPI0017E2A1EB
MSDAADFANDLMLGEIASILAARPVGVAVESAHECRECGDVIPHARREAVPGCVRCIECAGYHERGLC